MRVASLQKRLVFITTAIFLHCLSIEELYGFMRNERADNVDGYD